MIIRSGGRPGKTWIRYSRLTKLLFLGATLYLILPQDVHLVAQATTLAESVVDLTTTKTTTAAATKTSTPTPQDSTSEKPKPRADEIINERPPSEQQTFSETENASQNDVEKKAFANELLLMLHEQYGTRGADITQGVQGDNDRLQSRQGGVLGFGPEMMRSLLSVLGAEGDARRLTEWIKNTFNVASIPDLTTQFVVSKLGSVNCPALLRPDKEDSLVPRFLLFNEHFVDVPFELSINPDADECLKHGKFDPRRKTIILVHGYLTGYTLVDGMTNIKNRLLDLNRMLLEKTVDSFAQAADYHYLNGSSYVYTDDLNYKIQSKLYNVIFVDWFNGANPTPRSNYIKAAVNAQVVGRLIARFLSALVAQCGAQASDLQIIAHSLGCHVSGFTGKAMNAAGHRLGKILHLDPVGLCFGRLFSQPRFRLSPNDALETQAVHTSLNIFDNPLDGAHSNFLVNGGRDQVGCGGQSEIKNSTTSSVSLLFDPAARFGPCSHLRALALFEDDHSSEPGQCQMVGYRCQNYDRFLAGKCGQCDAANSQCRLMSLPPLSLQLNKINLGPNNKPPHHLYNFYHSNELNDLYASASSIRDKTTNQTVMQRPNANDPATMKQSSSSSSMANPRAKMMRDPRSLARSSSPAPTATLGMTSTTRMYGAPSYVLAALGRNEDRLNDRSDRGFLPLDKRERFAQAVEKLEKLRSETRTVLASGLTNLRGGISQALPQDISSELTNDDKAELGEQQTTTTTATTPTPTSTSTSAPSTSGGHSAAAINELPQEDHSPLVGPASRAHDDLTDQTPLGSQKPPAGSLNMPQYFLGTGALSPYCVNYYQFRVLISDSRLRRILKNNGLGSNRLLPQLSQHRGGLITAASTMQHRAVQADGHEMLHLTVKLTDTRGRFFRGFSMLESARALPRVANDLAGFANEPMVELTMLLNSTRPEPQRIGESIISYYFHQVVLADRVEINYMSNISPEIRAKYSSVLCPVAINDRHQLVRYIECNRVAAKK